MALHRGSEGADPVRFESIDRLDRRREERQGSSWHLGAGTLACPECDAPVALAAGTVAPADSMTCPVCAHGAAVRDFLSLAQPTRPARVDVRLVLSRRPALRAS